MSNLPPGVTPADIDKHFGEPETRIVHGTVHVAVSIETQFFDDKQECHRELMQAADEGKHVDVLGAKIAEIE